MIKLNEQDYDLFYNDPLLEIGIRLDSKSKIFRFSFKSNDEDYNKSLSLLDIKDRPIEILLDSSMLQKEYLKKADLKSNQLLLILRSMHESFIHCSLSKERFLDASDRIICRCLGVTEKDLDSAFKNNQADKVKSIQATNASMGCSSCREEVMSFFDNHFLYKADELSVRILGEINKNFEDFSLHCSMELSDYQFTAVSVKNAQVKVKAVKGKISVPRLEITKTLENYLGDKLLSGLKISVFY